MTQSMSRVGCCIDNGPTEGFWGITKAEMYYISDFCNEDELRQAIAEYIDYYNNYRYQKRFNNLAPIEVRNAALKVNSHFNIRYQRINKYKPT